MTLIDSIFGIRLYAICILIGIILAYLAGVKEGKKLGINKNFIFYGVVITVPCAILGARLWYVLFNLKDFDSFGEVCGFRNGKFEGLSGLAIHGGLLASLIVIPFYCKKNNVSLYKVLDIVAPGFLIGQICGRYGNFFNHELYGPVIQHPTAFQEFYPSWLTDNMFIGGAYHHPTFLYESCLNLLGLIFILILRRKSKKLQSGDIIFIYLIWYGIVRFITETLRMGGDANDPLMLGPIHVSRALSIIGIITGITMLILKHNVQKFKTVSYASIIEAVEKERIDTVIFDLDGTLLNTKSLIDHSFIYTFQHYFPDKEITQEDLDSFFGPTLEETFSRYTKDTKLINEMIEYYRAYNKEHHDEFVKAFPGAKSLLRSLHYKGYKVCVVSSKVKNMVEYGLEHNGMLKYVDFIIGEGQIKPKPDPEGIIIAMNHFAFAKNAIYVGDNPSDIYAGLNANKYYQDNKIDKSCKSCGVSYSLKYDKIKDIEGAYMISELEQLLDVINA